MLSRKSSICRFKLVGTDRLPSRLIAVHQSHSLVKDRYVLYQSAKSKGIQTCGPKGKKPARQPGKSREKTKRTSKSRLQIGEWMILLTNLPPRTAQSAGSPRAHALSMANGIIVEVVEAIGQNRCLAQRQSGSYRDRDLCQN